MDLFILVKWPFRPRSEKKIIIKKHFKQCKFINLEKGAFSVPF